MYKRQEVTVDRLEKNKTKLEALYKEGITETESKLEDLKKYLDIC